MQIVRELRLSPVAALFVVLQWSLLLQELNCGVGLFILFGGCEMFSAEVQAEILNLFFSQKKSMRSIAEKFGIHRKSVARVVRRRSVQLGRQSPVVRK